MMAAKTAEHDLSADRLLCELSEEDRKAIGKARLGKGRVRRYLNQIADANGDIGSPFRAESLLARLERTQDIDSAARAAGEEFHRLFHLAALDPLKAADVSRVPRGYGGVSLMVGSEAAYRKVGAALDALGGLGTPGGSCAYFVLGLDESLRRFASRQQWRGANPDQAKGVLLVTLTTLARHYGY